MHRLPRARGIAIRLLAGATLLVLTVGCQSGRPATPEVLVAGTDYAFQAPSRVRSGSTSFRFANRGRVPHEMALGELHAGITAGSLLAYAAAGRDPGDLAKVVGILIAGPGETALGTLSAHLEAGRTYLMICSFRDGDSLPPHLAMGMQASFVAE